MKIAVISDIHGNLPALQTTLAHVDGWRPDRVIVNGDVINRGPRPRECWELLARREQAPGWRIVRGNHEEYVVAWRDNVPRQNEASGAADRRLKIFQSSFWTFQHMTGYVAAIANLPEQVSVLAGDGSVVRLTHGSMRGNTDGIYPQTADDELAEQIAPAPAVFCTAHTHRPLVRTLNGTIVVNSGAAGTTFDGDPRISYAQLEWGHDGWQVEIVRIPYDRRRTERDFETSGFLEGGGPLVEIFLQEWKLARPLVNRWAAAYEGAVLSGQMTLQASVDTFLDEVL